MNNKELVTRELINTIFRWRKLKKYHKHHNSKWGMACAISVRVCVFSIILAAISLLVTCFDDCIFKNFIPLRWLDIAVEESAEFIMTHFIMWIAAPIFLVWGIATIAILVLTGVDINENVKL